MDVGRIGPADEGCASGGSARGEGDGGLSNGDVCASDYEQFLDQLHTSAKSLGPAIDNAMASVRQHQHQHQMPPRQPQSTIVSGFAVGGPRAVGRVGLEAEAGGKQMHQTQVQAGVVHQDILASKSVPYRARISVRYSRKVDGMGSHGGNNGGADETGNTNVSVMTVSSE